MTKTARAVGIIVPVFLATTFCLTVPFILIVADAAILVAAVATFVAERVPSRVERAPTLPRLE